MSGYAGLNQRKNRKLESTESSGVVQALRMESGVPAAGQAAPIVNYQ